jgi:VWFA-related protein
MTVAQLEQMLGTERAAHKSDIEIARKISDVELSERLTDLALGQLSKQFAGGSQPAMALLLLADRSSFLDPPANELPVTPAPDAATQQHLLEAAKRFAVQTLPNLPNLLATRTTFSFDDSPQEVTKGGYPERIGLHSVGSSKAEVSVWNEKERPLARTGYASSPAQSGLTTWGEFGSLLLIILSDSSEGRMVWSHGENTAAGVVAVFQYEVPKAASHYEINTPVQQIQHSTASNRWASDGGTSATVTTATIHNKPGYKGTLWVDPATGTIVRVTLVADLKGDSSFERIAILVDYGLVQIANKTLICPVRSLALASAPATVNASLKGAATEWLNENLFNGYHMFASTSRILTEQSAAAVPPAPSSTENAPNIHASPAAGEKSPPGSASTPSLPQQAATPSVEVPSGVLATAPIAKVENAEQNAASNEAGSMSEQPQAANPTLTAPAPATITASRPEPTSPSTVPSVSEAKPQYSAPPIDIHVNRVLLPVVVRDKQGRTVADLKKEDFQVLDEGKPRSISAFNVEKRGSSGSESAPGAEFDRNPQVTVNKANQSSILPERVTVLLFDDLHLTYDDTTYVQQAASKALDGVLSGSDVAAVVSMSGKINSGLTRDRAKLQDAIVSIRPEGINRTYKDDCPKIDYYQADLIENKHDPEAHLDVVSQIMQVCNPGTPQDVAERLADAAARSALALGRQDILVTYATLREIVRRMAKLPGQRSLLLVSDGFLPVEEEARYEESQLLDLAARSDVIINAIDARGLYTTSLTASDDMRGRSPAKVQDYRQRSKSIQEQAMGELADGTGGTFFHNNNNLDAGFKAITQAPEVVYMLELPLDGVKANDSYHPLKVKVDREGTTVQTRRGYLMPKEEKSKK